MQVVMFLCTNLHTYKYFQIFSIIIAYCKNTLITEGICTQIPSNMWESLRELYILVYLFIFPAWSCGVTTQSVNKLEHILKSEI